MNIAKGSALALGVSCIISGALAQDHSPIQDQAISPSVERNTVIPGTFSDSLSVRDNEVGDGFSVVVSDDNGIFPRKTKIEGHVVRIHWATRFRPPSMDLRFDDVLYPDGHTHPINAVPVPLNSRGIRHGRDGRMYMNMDRVNPGAYWAAGTVGGLIVGGIFNRPLLGGFIGGLFGAIAGQAAAHNPDNYRVARRGDKIGVLLRADIDGTAITLPASHADVDTGAIEVKLGDQVINFPEDQQPYWKGDVLMVPLPVMADQMDLSVDQSEDGPIDIQNQDNRLHLEQGSDQYRLNDASGTLKTPVENRGDVTYVPVEILAAISTRNVYVNGTKLPKKS